MFFRIVASRYKKKKYQYLRLMESYREGEKVKQKELMTLANLTQTPADTTNDILDELRQLLSISNSLSAYTGGSAQLSLMLALEAAFQPKKVCPVNILEEALGREREKKFDICRDGELFFRLVKKYHPGQPGNSDLVFWAGEAGTCQSDDHTWMGYLMNSSGFPLEYFLFERKNSANEKMTQIIEEYKRVYNTENIWIFLPTYSSSVDLVKCIYPEGYTQTNVVICQQRTNWVEYPFYSAEQYTMLKNDRENSPEKTRELINTVSNFLKYYRWYIERINNIRDDSIAGENFFDMCIMLHLFGKLIEQNIGSKYILPVRERYKNTYRYIAEKEQLSDECQQFSQIAD